MTYREATFWYWLADRLPRKLIYFCFVKVMAHSTTGKYGSTIASELTGLEAIKRYSIDFGI